MGIWNILFRRKKFERPAKITLTNIKKYMQGNYRRILIKFGLLESDYIKEQIEWRRKQVLKKSPNCIKTGECICGCDTEGLLMSDPPCEGECFPKMMSEKEWKNFIKNG